MSRRPLTAWLAATALVAGAGALAACGDKERSAEAETPVAEAEVSTTLPESQVSDQQLQNAAEGAAAAAETPQGSSTAVVISPPTDAATTTATTTPPATGGAPK
ncbi:hypothetical protein [Phenylobacterium sp.]|uniref:hypothetical protein n=1 Tax=Phenylobacterium sp. TaxID=1871053 RepID=UPI002FE052F0